MGQRRLCWQALHTTSIVVGRWLKAASSTSQVGGRSRGSKGASWGPVMLWHGSMRHLRPQSLVHAQTGAEGAKQGKGTPAQTTGEGAVAMPPPAAMQPLADLRVQLARAAERE